MGEQPTNRTHYKSAITKMKWLDLVHKSRGFNLLGRA